MIELSSRLKGIADLVPSGVNVSDIGSDHCLLPIYLASRGDIPYLQAIDNKKGPFLTMKKAVEDANLTDKIELSLSSGLDCLSEKTNCIVLAGMGGKLIQEILLRGKSALSHVDYILIDAHRDLVSTRQTIVNLSYQIDDETMIFEGGLYYSLIRFKKGETRDYSLQDYFFGPVLRKKKGPVFKAFLLENKKRIQGILLQDLSIKSRNHYDELLAMINAELARL